MTVSEKKALSRCRLWTIVFMVSLFLSGATAIPLNWEMNFILAYLSVPDVGGAGIYHYVYAWLRMVGGALRDTDARYPFLAYGYDWLAFGHFMIALVYVGALRDPVRNIWLFDYGMIACVLVIPFALVMGEIREIPFGWRLIDCAFGIAGFPLLWMAKREALRLTKR